MTGIVQYWSEEKGYGFIRSEEIKAPHTFVHCKSVKYGDLAKGVRVEYELGVDRQSRPCAVDVRVLDGCESSS